MVFELRIPCTGRRKTEVHGRAAGVHQSPDSGPNRKVVGIAVPVGRVRGSVNQHPILLNVDGQNRRSRSALHLYANHTDVIAAKDISERAEEMGVRRAA